MNDIQNTAEKQMFDVLTGKKDNEEKRNLKVFKSELVDVEHLSTNELFNGFDSMSRSHLQELHGLHQEYSMTVHSP